MGFGSKFFKWAGIFAAPFTGGLSLIATAAAVVAPKLVDKVVDSVIGFVMQPFMGLLGPIDAGLNDAEANRQQGVLVTRRAGGAEPIPVVYGMRQVGGIITFAETGATNNKYLWVAYVFSEGLVEGLYEVRIDDLPIPAGLIGQLNSGQTVTIKEGKFKDRVTMRWSPGVYWATASSSYLGKELKASLFADSPSFKESMVYNGLATLFVRYEWLEIKTQEQADANPFSGSIPEVAVTMMGRRVASLVTSTSESAAYEGVGYTERYSTNPAEILLDYLRNPRYGKGLKNTDIDWDTFRTAAAKCNTQVTYTATGTRGPIMTCNYVLSTSYTVFDNVKLLLQGMRSYLPYVQGRYRLRVEDAGNPSDITSGAATIVAECRATPQIIDGTFINNTYEIMGEVQYNGIDRASKYNQVVVTYVDPNNKWSNQQAVYPDTEAERQTYIAQDGNRENKLETTFPGITNYAMAYDFARLLFFKSRYQETATLRVSSHAFELEPGDNIRIISKMLAFYDTPWRVVNITYNNDYTFSLSCVRNPDWLYPYTKAFEPDRVLPIRVPRGVDIYYPPNTTQNISLQPPTRQPYIPGAVVPPSNYNPGNPYIPGVVQPPGVPTVDPTVLNPIPTNPIGVDGGGIGGPGGDTNVNPPNNNPPTAPQVQPLDDVVDFTNVTYVLKNGLIYARLTFRQPDHAMYSGLRIYYKSTGASFVEYEENTIPGVNQTVVFDLGPLAVSSSVDPRYNVYDVFARVKYTDGQLSTQFVRFQLTPIVGTSANPSEIVQISSAAWPNPSTVIEAGRRDTRIESVRGLVASVGAAGTPRTLSFDLIQDIRTQPANFDVSGVRVYWRLASDTYYNTVTTTFTNYSPGNQVTVAFTGDIGVVGGSPSYDFVFRLIYNNGDESDYVYITTWRVESPFAVYPYDPSYGASRSTKLLTEYPVVTVDQAPPGAVANALDTSLGIGSNYAGMGAITAGTATGVRLFLDPPALANRGTWRGVRVRYRPIIPGTNPTLTEYVDKSVSLSTLTGLKMVEVWGLVFDQDYEMIITPIVVSGGTEQDSNFSLFGKGLVHNRTSAFNYPFNDNWAPSWSFVQADTKTATGGSGQSFDAGAPTLDIISMELFQSPVTNTGYAGFYKVGSSTVIRNQYIRLVYNGDKIANLTAVYVYRRNRSTSNGPTGSNGPPGVGLHAGVGRWERITIAHSSTGNKIVNLRMPTSSSEFNSYYGTNSTFYNTTNLTLTPVGEDAGTVPLMSNTLGNTDWLIVPVISGTASSKGHLVRGQNIGTTSSKLNLMLPNKPAIVTYASEPTIQDSSYTAGYLRRLSEARTTPVGVNDWDYYTPRQIGGSTVTQVLTTPADGPATV